MVRNGMLPHQLGNVSSGSGHGTTMMKGYREPPRVEREDCQAIPKQDMILASLTVKFLT